MTLYKNTLICIWFVALAFVSCMETEKNAQAITTSNEVVKNNSLAVIEQKDE